jgi:CubicO group peptidase (beta-lactamase class C family)
VFSAVRDLAAQRMEETGVPGVALGVLADGKLETAGLGVTSVEHPLEVRPDTLFQIGSITKTFTGTAAMRLVEHGELDLDEPVRTYLPQLRLADEDAAARATMRHLLTHTAGWVGDYFDDLGPGEDALARMVESMAELPQVTPLGELWSYNNSGFYLAGCVLEVLREQPFETLVRELVLDPLGLERTFLFPDEVMTHRFVVGQSRTTTRTPSSRGRGRSGAPRTPPAGSFRPWTTCFATPASTSATARRRAASACWSGSRWSACASRS